jgi:hypothetical protein
MCPCIFFNIYSSFLYSDTSTDVTDNDPINHTDVRHVYERRHRL